MPFPQWVAVGAALLLAAAARAQTFGLARPLNTDAAVDRRQDGPARLAADGTGTWVAVWSGNVGAGGDILMARSVDDGMTWSDPRPLEPEPAMEYHHDQAAMVAGDGQGSWVAVWQHFLPSQGNAIVVARSADGGATWTPPSRLRTGGVSSDDTFPDVATDQAGTWIAVWGAYQPLMGFRLYAARSLDAGATWLRPVVLDQRPAEVLGQPKITSTRDGGWIAVWESTSGIEVARSTDGGATWREPARVHANDPMSIGQSPSVAADRAGIVVVVWELRPVVHPRAPPSKGDFGILLRRSTDAGSTWSQPERASAPTPTGRVPVVVADGHGNWAVAWEGPFGRKRLLGDGMVIRWSHDGAQTWVAPTALNGATADDSYDGSPILATDGRGRWMASWYSSPADPLSDSDVVAARLSCGCPLCGVCDPSGACVTAPRPDCQRSALGAASTIALVDRTGLGADRLGWVLRTASRASGGLGGDPRFDTGVGLCAYGPDGTLVFRATAPAGLHCGDVPCWSRGPRGGWTYHDREGRPDGVVGLSVGAGAGRFGLRARGGSLGLPVLPTRVPLTAQIQTGSGACWEVIYDAASVRESSTRRFVAKVPPPHATPRD